jgi:hypothetical protein
MPGLIDSLEPCKLVRAPDKFPSLLLDAKKRHSGRGLADPFLKEAAHAQTCARMDVRQGEDAYGSEIATPVCRRC